MRKYGKWGYNYIAVISPFLLLFIFIKNINGLFRIRFITSIFIEISIIMDHSIAGFLKSLLTIIIRSLTHIISISNIAAIFIFSIRALECINFSDFFFDDLLCFSNIFIPNHFRNFRIIFFLKFLNSSDLVTDLSSIQIITFTYFINEEFVSRTNHSIIISPI